MIKYDHRRTYHRITNMNTYLQGKAVLIYWNSVCVTYDDPIWSSPLLLETATQLAIALVIRSPTIFKVPMPVPREQATYVFGPYVLQVLLQRSSKFRKS